MISKIFEIFLLLMLLLIMGSLVQCFQTICSQNFTHVICNCNFSSHEPEWFNRFERYNQLTITNCFRLSLNLTRIIKNESLVRQIKLENIPNLEVISSEDNTKVENPIRFYVRNCSMDEIATKTFQGNFYEIQLDSIEIRKSIQAHAFTDFVHNQQQLYHRLAITNSKITEINSQAFKLLELNEFRFVNNRIDRISNYAFSRLTILNQFEFAQNRFESDIPSGTFDRIHLKNLKPFEIRSNLFARTVDSNSFDFRSNNRLRIISNYFGHLSTARISDDLNKTNQLLHWAFINNTIGTFDSKTFATFALDHIDSLSVEDFCTCPNITIWFRSLNANAFANCTKSNQNILKFFMENCPNAIGTNGMGSMGLSQTLFYHILLAILVLLLVAIVSGLIVYYIFVRVKRKSTPNTATIIVPDGRTYRETELQVIFDQIQPLTTDL